MPIILIAFPLISIGLFFLIKKWDIVFLLGESKAGKDTLLHILKGDGFQEKYVALGQAQVVRIRINNWKKIDVINTAGTDKYGTEEFKSKKYTIRCYVFDSTKYYDKDEIIKLGIQNTINEVKSFSIYKKVKCVALGTRAADIKNKDEIENEVNSMGGIKCKIFELSDNPQKEVIEFLFKE